MLKDSFEGLLEGHESGFHKLVYRFTMFTVTVFTIVSAILPLTESDASGFAPLNSVALLGLLMIVLTLIRWYRVDGMPGKFRQLIYVLMFLLVLADAYAITVTEIIPKPEEVTPEPPPVCPIPCIVPKGDECKLNPPDFLKCISYANPLALCGTPAPTTPSPTKAR